MDDRRFDREQDAELESLLAESLSTPPPDVLIPEITPWRQAMNRVLTGLALSSITLNFLWLDTILPTVGMVLLLLGLRTLRQENRYFKLWWMINLPLSGWSIFCLLRRAVPGSQSFFALPAVQALGYTGLVLQILKVFFLWRGLKAIHRKTGLPPRDCGESLMVWYGVVIVLALIQYQGWLLGLPVFIAYFFILRDLYRLSGLLEEAGYTVQPAPVRIPDRILAQGILAVLAVGFAVCYLFLNRFPMDWRPVDQAEHSQVTKLEQHLLELGFPEDVLADLAPEDILACEGAVRVVSDVSWEELEEYYNAKGPKITSVAVELAGERERWRIFHHFALREAPRRGTYAIQLWPTWRDVYEGWSQSLGTTFTGRVLYDRDGTTFWSPYFFLGSETYTSNSIFWGPRTNTDVFASFSLPRKGENHRGYVCYEAAENQDGYIINSWFNFVQPTGFFQYPCLSAQEWQMEGHFNGYTAPFLYIQDALQFYPNDVDVVGTYGVYGVYG